MERRRVVFGDTLVELGASFPVARWAGARAGDPNDAPVRLRLRMNSFFPDGRGQAVARPPEDFTFDSTLLSFLMPANAQVSVSNLVSRVHHPYLWVVVFLETEISSFAFQAAQVARHVGSHGFDLFADVYEYFPPLVPGEFDYLQIDYLLGILGPYPAQGLGAVGGEVWPTALIDAGEEDAEELDGLLVLSPEEELLVAGGEETQRDPASSPEIKSLKTVQYGKEGGINQEACPICCDDFEAGMELVAMPLCFHAFHAHCLLRWLEESRACPLCRTEIAAEPTEEEEEDAGGP